MGVDLNYRDWVSIEVSYNTRTLSAVVEGCDINSNENIQKSVEIEVKDINPLDKIVLHGDSHNSSFKNLSFYNKFVDVV